MGESRGRWPVEAVRALVAGRVRALAPEPVALADLAGRVLAGVIRSPIDLPPFRRAAMDGYAVRTGGGTALRLVGASAPGRRFEGAVRPGEAVRILTGAAVPDGADAVVRIEDATADGDGVRVSAPPVAGRHVIRIGEDVAAGAELLAAGRLLRPQDVGLLAALGVGSAACVRRPRARVVVTGNELLPPGEAPAGDRVVDSNSPMLAALLARDGADLLPTLRLPDDLAAITDCLRDADADIVLLSGGTSVGPEDYCPTALAAAGELAVHGVAVRPAGPMGVGFAAGRPVFLLPGSPVACLCGYDLFAGEAVRRLGGRSAEWPYRAVRGELLQPVASAAGRVDYVRFTQTAGGGFDPLPARGGSSLGSTVRADGFLLVPAGRERLEAGEAAEGWLYG